MEFTASAIRANDPPTMPLTSFTIPKMTLAIKPSTAAWMASRYNADLDELGKLKLVLASLKEYESPSINCCRRYRQPCP